MPDKPQLYLSRPADQSLEAYKKWIIQMLQALTGRTESTMTPEEWEEGWREFWDGYTEDEERPQAKD